MQLKPIKGTYIFEQPRYGKFRQVHEVFPIWNLFDSVVLDVNHRQGSDREYAEILNRMRFKEKTDNLSDEDFLTLQSRVMKPTDETKTIKVFGKNATVNNENEKRLNCNESYLHISEAIHIPSKRKVNVKSSGTIEETAFLQTLRLKVGARVMVIHNINTNDGLTNGAQGEVVDILEKEGRIHYVLVRFDNPNIGEEQRRTHRNLPSVARSDDITPIEQFSLSYTLGDVRKDHAARVSLRQFPLKLCWAVTAHKVCILIFLRRM